MEAPLKSEIIIGTHRQKIVYEGEGILCLAYGRLGHISTQCPTTKKDNKVEKESTTNLGKESPGNEWEIV